MATGVNAAVAHSCHHNLILLIMFLHYKKGFSSSESERLCLQWIVMSWYQILTKNIFPILMRMFSNIGMDFGLCSPSWSSCPPRAALEFIVSLNPVHGRLLSQTWGIFQWPSVPGWGHQVSAQCQVYRGMKKIVCYFPCKNKPNTFIQTDSVCQRVCLAFMQLTLWEDGRLTAASSCPPWRTLESLSLSNLREGTSNGLPGKMKLIVGKERRITESQRMGSIIITDGSFFSLVCEQGLFILLHPEIFKSEVCSRFQNSIEQLPLTLPPVSGLVTCPSIVNMKHGVKLTAGILYVTVLHYPHFNTSA